MSTEEVLQVRIMERSNAAFAKRRKELIDELDPVSANRYRDALSEDEAGEVEVTIWHAGL